MYGLSSDAIRCIYITVDITKLSMAFLNVYYLVHNGYDTAFIPRCDDNVSIGFNVLMVLCSCLLKFHFYLGSLNRCDFRMEVNNTFQSCNGNNAGWIPVIKILQGLQFTENLAQEEKELCRSLDSLFETLNSKFRLQPNKTILSFPYYKFSMKSNENAEQWEVR